MGRTRLIGIALLVLLAACGNSSPTPADPRVLVRQGVEATLTAGTFHLSVALDGTLKPGDTGAALSLDGTTVEADVDVAATATHATFGVPPLLGLSGEVIVIGADAYLQSSLTGPNWVHTRVAAGDTLGPLTNPAAALGTVEGLLDTGGVELVTRELTDCDGAPFRHVEMAIPAQQLSGLAALSGGLIPPGTLADGLVLDLYLHESTGRLVEVSTRIDSATTGTLSLRAVIGSFGEAVQVSAPPAADVQEGSGLPF